MPCPQGVLAGTGGTHVRAVHALPGDSGELCYRGSVTVNHMRGDVAERQPAREATRPTRNSPAERS